MQQKSLQQLMHLVRTTRNLTDTPFTFVMVKDGLQNALNRQDNKWVAASDAMSQVLTIQPDQLVINSVDDLPVPDRAVSFIVSQEIRDAAKTAGRETYDLFSPADGAVYDVDAPDDLIGYLHVERY